MIGRLHKTTTEHFLNTKLTEGVYAQSDRRKMSQQSKLLENSNVLKTP